MDSSQGFETRAIHAGQDPDPQTGAVTVPIYQTSTFAQQGVGKHQGYEYARTDNPTRTALQTCIASLESADFGVAFASGLAAEDAILRMLRPGDHLILGDDAYGGTFRLISKVFGPMGIEWSAADLTNTASLAAVWRPETRIVWAETPTNPELNIVDIEALATETHRLGGLCVIDNTFATPYLQRPIELGADLVVHSATKYLGGHSDVVGGFVATNDSEWNEHLRFVQNAVGAVPAPQDCFLVLRGLKTLGVRMDRHCENAAAVVELLEAHPEVETVFYPGLVSHPGHGVAMRQMSGFGGMVSFITNGDADRAKEIAERTTLFTLAESLGAVESLIEHPGAMTHLSAAGSPLEVSDRLLRLSVGIESIDDLLTDLTHALS